MFGHPLNSFEPGITYSVLAVVAAMWFNCIFFNLSKMSVNPDGVSTTVHVTSPAKNARRGPTQV